MVKSFAVDQQQTNFNGSLQHQSLRPQRYAPYGYSSPRPELLGFNGEHPDALTGHYQLGNGYRGFNPITMRFNSPDSMAPFGRGGLNMYAYCYGDPINLQDPSGHSAISRFIARIVNRLTQKKGVRGAGAYKVNNIHIDDTESTLNTKPRPRMEANMDDYLHIGYHGSGADFTNSLEAGITTRAYRGYGLKGFFVTSSYSTAKSYADGFTPHSGHVFNVYRKKDSEFKYYRDYVSYERPSSIVAFQEPAYDSLLVRAHTQSSLVRRGSLEIFNDARQGGAFPRVR